MKTLPENPYGLTNDHLAKVRSQMLSLSSDKDLDPKDRINAAKVLTGIVDQIWKFTGGRPADTDIEQEDADPLEQLKVVA